MQSIDATINLIDDNSEVLDTTCEIVRSIGFRAQVFRAPDEFLRQHDVNRPGCLVADLRIPGITGIEILRELSALQSLLPAIFVASHANVADTVNLMQLGAVTLLEKPYRDRTLIDAIESAVRLDGERRMVAARHHELDQRVCRLSENETKLLHGLLAGKTNKQISCDLGIATRTVEYRRRNIYLKLEVQSIAEMVAAVAELERLTDIRALLSAPPIRVTDSRSTSFCMPLWLRTVGKNCTAIDRPNAVTRVNPCSEKDPCETTSGIDALRASLPHL